jgi:WD40 repeat protein
MRTSSLFTLLLGITFVLQGYSQDEVPRSAFKEPSEIRIDPAPNGFIFGVNYSKDGKMLAIACEDKSVSVHDAATGKLIRRLEGHSHRVWTAAFSPDSRHLVSCSGEYSTPDDGGEVKLWDLKTGKESAIIEKQKQTVYHATFSPDGKSVVSSTYDGSINIWDAESGKLTNTLKGHTKTARVIKYTPDHKYIATGSQDGTVRFWDAQSGKLVKTIVAYETGVQCLAFSPCNRYLATTTWPTGDRINATIAIWDWQTSRQLGTFSGPRRNVLTLDFSPDSRLLACGGGSYTQFGDVKVFEVATGKERVHLEKHKGWVECVRFSPDGRFLISAGGTQKKMPGEIHIWRLADTIKSQSIDTKKLSEAQLTAFWDTLGSTDDVGFETLKTLIASPTTALSLFKERVKFPAAPDARAVAELIAKLDDAKFAEREKASMELRAMNELIEPVLLKTSKNPASDEVRGRVEQLLKRVQAPNMAAFIVRSLRIVEILDRIGTPEAKQLLTEFAKGTPETWLAREASRALTRMERR